MKTFKLENGVEIPAIGMGTGWMNTSYRHPRFLIKRVCVELKERLTGEFSEEIKYNASYEIRKILKFSKSVKSDAQLGYRLFDTACSYNNCVKMGKALDLKKNRDKFFIISKCSNYNQRNHTVLEEFENTLKELNTDYIDLYLIHWPQTGHYIETWRILEELYLSGKVKAIGVSNFNIHHLEDILGDCRVRPMADEVECHPMLQQKELREFCKMEGIQIIAHTPTGKMRSNVTKSVLQKIAAVHGRSVAQIILRWHYQLGDVCVPNTLNKGHAAENLEIFDFELDAEEMDIIAELDCNMRIWPDPDNCDFTKL